MALLLLGILAGALTTIAGMGGGILLLASVSLMTDPREALAITAPALFVGNLHRALLYRAKIDRRVGTGFVLGAFPGSLAGALMVVALPLWLLNTVMVAMVGLAIVRALGLWRWSPSNRTMIPAAAGVGMIAATSGGAGLLVGPLLMAAGLSGETYVATTALAAVAMHLGRILGYGASGMLTAHTLGLAAVLTVAILCGNLLGVRLRARITPALSTRIELSVLVVAVLLCLAGVAR